MFSFQLLVVLGVLEKLVVFVILAKVEILLVKFELEIQIAHKIEIIQFALIQSQPIPNIFSIAFIITQKVEINNGLLL